MAVQDPSLKVKLLHSLLQDYVPTQKHPLANPKELSYVVFNVKTHKLLSINSSNSVVDSWVKRLLKLVSSKSPNTCWVGLCLLGLTCQECTSQRFLSSYVDWLNKALSQIQDPQAVPYYVKVASCASLSDLFIRLSTFPNAKKDATVHVTRVVPALLKLLNEETSSVVLDEATLLLRNMINFFPVSIQRHYDNVENVISLKILSGQCSASVLENLGSTLSLLPRSKGDADSWSLLMDKVLWCTNHLLTDLLQGLENEGKSGETIRALLPSGKESPAPLGGSEKISDLSTAKPERALVARVTALLQCCCHMLRNPYPAVVSIPINSILSLAERVLLIDSSSSHSSFEFMTILKPEFISTEILLLQFPALEILSAIVEGLKSQTLTRAANIAQLVNKYLKNCKLPDLRRQGYLIIKDLLHTMGVGTAIHLSQDIISNVLIDLNNDKNDGQSAKVSTVPRQKKRKLSNVEKTGQELSGNDGSEVEVPHDVALIPLRIAALEALEELLHVGGSMKSEAWRGNIDQLLFSVATSSFSGGYSQDYQLVALRALLASLISPGRARPPHLGQSFELFRRGAQEASTKVSDYCSKAFTSLEVLIHPRALPFSHHSTVDEYKFQNPEKMHGEPESEDDDLNENWLGNDDDEMEVQEDIVMQDNNEQHDSLSKEGRSLDTAFVVPRDNDRQIENRSGESLVRYTSKQSAESIRNSSAHVVELETDSEVPKDVSMEKGKEFMLYTEEQKVKEVTQSVSGTDGMSVTLARLAQLEKCHDGSGLESDTLAHLERLEKHGGLGFELDKDGEKCMDLFPDIVDGDPDSDSDSD